MSWFMPSWGRPHKMKELLKAPGGWPPEVIVQVNEDDLTVVDYYRSVQPLWQIEIVPAGSRCSDVHRLTYERHPYETYYGFLMDDLWPITPNWWTLLVEAAGRNYFSIPQGPGYPKRIRGAFVMGGDLVRAMGSVVPAPVRHWHEDLIWDDIIANTGLIRPVKEAIVDHRNFEFGTAELDATYKRRMDFSEHDDEVYKKWMVSPERTELLIRVSLMMEEAA